MSHLQVTNFKRYQSADIVAKSKGRPPWVKMHREFFIDYELRCLKPDVRLLALFLTSFASEFLTEFSEEDEMGTFPNDPGEIARRVALPPASVKRGLDLLLEQGYLSPAARDDRGDSFANDSPPRARDARSASKSSSESSGKPKVEVEPRESRASDPIWDALTEVCGEVEARTERSRRGSVVQELKEVGATPEQIRDRAARFKRGWSHLTFTDKALVAHWSKLATLEPSNGRRGGLSAQEIMEQARTEAEREAQGSHLRAIGGGR